MSNIWRFTVEIQLGGAIPHVAEFNQHWQSDVGALGSEPSAATMLDKILSHYSSSGHNLSKMVAVLNTDAAITRATVYQRVTPGSGDTPGQAQEALGLAGTVSPTTDRLPAGIATWIHWTTAKVGRSFRGGTHWPGSYQPGDLTSTGLWEAGSTFRINLATLGTATIDTINDIDAEGTDLNPIIYSHVRDARGQDASEQVTSYSLNLTPRFVRKRMKS